MPAHVGQIASIVAVGVLLAACIEARPSADVTAVERGEKLSHNCTPCHNLERRRNQIGPHLVAIIGRKAATVDGYNYSRAMKEADIVWTPDVLETFIMFPLGVVPHSKMALAPVSTKEAEDIVIYLQSLTP